MNFQPNCIRHRKGGNEMEQKNGFGIAALVLGIVGFITGFLGIGILLDILAIIFGIIAICSKKQKSGLGIAGLVVGSVGLLLMILIGWLFSDDTAGTISSDTTETQVVESIDNTSDELNDSDFEVTEYSFHDGVENTMYVVVVKNNSDKTVNFDCEATALDADQNEVGVSSDYDYTIEPGKEGCMQMYYDTEAAETFKYDLEYKESSHESALSSLDFKETQNDDNVVVSCSNNSDVDVQSVEAKIIFFKGDTPVSCTYGFMVDDDLTLPAGETKSTELDSYQEFDNYKIYYSAQR